jgi:predicted NBD/HSP70 family sugar kinase
VLVSAPGIVDEAAGQVIYSPNLHWLEAAPLSQLVSQVWDLPMVLVQEIRALALGHLAAEPIREDFFLADFGHGVGGAVVIEGQLYPHPTPLSGEFGHTPVPGNPRPCGCGGTGCLETLVSRRGLLESFGAAKRNLRNQKEQIPGWEALLEHVNQNGLEPWLVETLDTAAKVIAGGLNVLGVHRVVVTGSLTEFPLCVIERLTGEIKRGALWARFGEVTCQAAVRRRSAGLVAVGIDRLVLPADRFPRLADRREPAGP